MGGTGYQPVPSSHWPDGMTRTPLGEMGPEEVRAVAAFRAASRRSGQAGRLCHPALRCLGTEFHPPPAEGDFWLSSAARIATLESSHGEAAASGRSGFGGQPRKVSGPIMRAVNIKPELFFSHG